MAQTNLCFACMNPIDAPEAVCPLCGHDNHTRDNGPGLLGHTLLQNQYLVGRVLGRGGFGVTYLGFDLNLERRVAIKEFFPSHLVMRTHDNQTLSALTGSEEDYQHGCQRALKESQVAARMGQIYGVVQVHNVLSANNTVYIVMDYVDGDTLTGYVEKHGGMLTLPEAAELCGLSTSYFAAIFRKQFGVSFARYERNFRLNRAAGAIRRGATLKEAAAGWGFCDKSHLARLLKQHLQDKNVF